MADIEKSEVPEETETQFTELEQKALDQGWRPKEEWDGDPEAWRSAKEFLDRGELFKKIDDQNRTIKEFKRTLDDLAKHHAKVREMEYKRALEDLKTQKREALLEGDADKVVDIDERIDLVREAQRTPEPVVQPEPAVNPIFSRWLDNNPWYNSNEAMRAYADRLGGTLGVQGGMSPVEILQEVEKQVKKEFAHKFTNPRRSQAPAVESEGGKGGKKTAETIEFTADERQVAQRMAKLIDGMIVEKYLSEIAALKKSGA